MKRCFLHGTANEEGCNQLCRPTRTKHFSKKSSLLNVRMTVGSPQGSDDGGDRSSYDIADIHSNIIYTRGILILRKRW